MTRAAFLGALALSPIHAFGDAALFGRKPTSRFPSALGIALYEIMN
jgi:hypothetical protein